MQKENTDIILDVGIDKEYEYCLRCGRKLKNPVARKIGYGSVCITRIPTPKQKRLFDVIAKN